MSFIKKISKLDDIAFHLVNKLNKKKLKLNLLLNKDWDKIIGPNYQNKSELNNLNYNEKSDSCSIEIKCDPSIVLDLRSDVEKIILRIEQKIGVKVKKINFFQDIFDHNNDLTDKEEQKYHTQSKILNKNELNDIKECGVISIFKRIDKLIKNENN